jgi:hypothetical protein
LAASLGLFMASSFIGCKDDPKDEPVVTDNTPVIDVNFKYEIAEDGNTVTFTSLYDAATPVIWTNVTSGASSTEVSYVTKLGKAGDYKFVFSVSVDGEYFPSDTFTVTIAKSDLSFLKNKMWIALTGGEGKSKTWKLDLTTEGKCQYFVGPLYFSGESDVNDGTKDYEPTRYWSWDVTSLPYTIKYSDASTKEMTSYFNWSPEYSSNTWLMSAQDYGTITFNADDQTVTTTIFGETTKGTFTFDTTTLKLTLSGVHLPIDTARLNEPQFTDLSNLRVYSIGDSAIQIGIKRAYEGKNDDGSQKNR